MKILYILFIIALPILSFGQEENDHRQLYSNNIEKFWRYCVKCVQDNCLNERLCKDNTDNEKLKSAFSLAIVEQDINTVKYFLSEVKVNPNMVLNEESGKIFLDIIAYSKGSQSVEMAKLMVEKGVDVNHLSNGPARTPLLTAIWKKNNSVARYLLQNGADPNIKSGLGYGACVFAHRWANYEIMPDLPDCCERIMNIEPDAVLVEEKLRPPELVKYCKK